MIPADLVVLTVNAYPLKVARGSVLTVECAEKNRVSGDSSPFRTAICLRKTESSCDHLLHVGEEHSLKVGESRQFSYRVTIPSNTPLGEYYVYMTVFIDLYGNKVLESNVENNIGRASY